MADTPKHGGSDGDIDWDRFPVEAISPLTFAKRNLIHWNLLAAVWRRRSGGILEVGIGSGAQSAVLSRIAAPVFTVDNNLGILARARANLDRFGRSAAPIAADAFRLPFPDARFGVALSQGLMEHFSDEEIGTLIREQLRVCRSVVFSVPSDRYPRQDMGNERLMSARRWAAIVGDAIDPWQYRVRSTPYRLDTEAWKYSLLARRWLGSFSVLVTVDPVAGAR